MLLPFLVMFLLPLQLLLRLLQRLMLLVPANLLLLADGIRYMS
jgi:hypothetical protein